METQTIRSLFEKLNDDRISYETERIDGDIVGIRWAEHEFSKEVAYRCRKDPVLGMYTRVGIGEREWWKILYDSYDSGRRKDSVSIEKTVSGISRGTKTDPSQEMLFDTSEYEREPYIPKADFDVPDKEAIEKALLGIEVPEGLDDAVVNMSEIFSVNGNYMRTGRPSDFIGKLKRYGEMASRRDCEAEIISAMSVSGSREELERNIMDIVGEKQTGAVASGELGKTMNGWVKRAWCLFEQSGTFKRAFEKNGVPAMDFDLRNSYGETDDMSDLFAAVDAAYEGKASLFDRIGRDDITLAFFPCIHFCDSSELLISGNSSNLRLLDDEGKEAKIAEKKAQRMLFAEKLKKLVALYETEEHGTLIIENPWSGSTYLKKMAARGEIPHPAIVDNDRSMHGDRFKKPTSFFVIGRKLDIGMFADIRTPSDMKATVHGSKSASKAGECSEDRSMIEQTYADNFVSNVIFGRGLALGGTYQQRFRGMK